MSKKKQTALRTSIFLPLVSCVAMISGAHATDAYIDKYVSFTQGTIVGAGTPVSAMGNPLSMYPYLGLPTPVNPDIILGAPVAWRVVSVPENVQAVYEFSNMEATQGLTVYALDYGADEHANVYGRLHTVDPWTLIGQVSEPLVSGIGAPIGTTLSLTGTGLSGVHQVLVLGLDNGGSLPGFDLMGIKGNSMSLLVPEPETYAMMLAGLGLIGFMSRRSKAA